MFRGVLLGLVMLAVPGLLGALLLRSDSPAPSWPHSPPPSKVAAEKPARWDEPARASLGLLRRVTAKESRSAQATLAACERSAARAEEARRVKAFRRCATTPLARVGGMGTANSHMLYNLAGTAGPSEACRQRVLSLSGMTGTLGGIARTTLRTWVASWDETLSYSRAIRATAREALKFARAKGWSSTCRALPPASAEPPPVA